MFINENVNPKNKNTGDCVVRAIAKTMDEPWEHIYDELCRIGREKKCMPNAQIVYTEYLKKNGWRKIADRELFKNGKRLRVGQLSEEFPIGIYLIKITKHLTTLIDGDVYDTWNPRDYCVYGLWVKS